MGLSHLWFFEVKEWASLLQLFILWVVYSVYLANFWGLFALLYQYLGTKPWTIPFLWVSIEWIRSLGPIGNTAAILGSSQAYNLPILQLASLGGAHLISFFCVCINVLIYTIVSAIKKQHYRHGLLLSALLVLVSATAFFYGKIKIQEEKNQENYTVSIIQANHNQHKKLDRTQYPSLRQDYLDLIKKELINTPKTELIILPETITPDLNLSQVEFMSELTRLKKSTATFFLFGTPSKGKSPTTFYNSVALVLNDQFLLYHKTKLMPFGEYWPLKPLFKILNLESLIPLTEYTADKTAKLLTLNPSVKIGNAICLEAAYSKILSQHTRSGATLLCVLANNAWFFDSSAAERLFKLSILRAVENNRYLIQSANTGISGTISNTGQVINQSHLQTQATLTGRVKLINKHSLYIRYGNWIIWISILGLLLLQASRKFSHKAS